MNISRSVSRLLCSRATRKWSIPCPVPLLHPSSPLSTRTRNPNPFLLRKYGKKVELPRPSEIPYQAKVANTVQLVGTIGVPIELQRLSNGDYAVLILVQEKTSPKLWLLIIFQGDLAQIAACHLKENDLVYVTGQLIGEEPSLAVQDGKTRSQVQVSELTSQFEKCQQVLSYISETIGSKAMTVEGQKKKLEETKQQLNQRRELISKYRSCVEELIMPGGSR